MNLLHVKHSDCLSVVIQSLARQISKCRVHFENRLEKNEKKNRIASNKCDICTLDIMIDFH